MEDIEPSLSIEESEAAEAEETDGVGGSSSIFLIGLLEFFSFLRD